MRSEKLFIVLIQKILILVYISALYGFSNESLAANSDNFKLILKIWSFSFWF